MTTEEQTLLGGLRKVVGGGSWLAEYAPSKLPQEERGDFLTIGNLLSHVDMKPWRVKAVLAKLVKKGLVVDWIGGDGIPRWRLQR